jgi:hypothetical protein
MIWFELGSFNLFIPHTSIAYRIIAFTIWYLSLGTSYRLSTLSCLP